MQRFELGMSLDYVSNWKVCDAIREVFQNALDEEIQNPENKWYFNYDEESKTLRIGNKLSKLPTKTLLLGCSSKRESKDTIGSHGEGYKVATIVLLRSGCSVKIYNYNEKEIWIAKIIKSRRYKTEIGVFDVEKMGIFKSVPEHNLIFEIGNISKEDYKEAKKRILWLQDNIGETKETIYGRVLLDNKYKGKVYVKGLYVCDKSQLVYGYDLVPSLISLDRDRGLIDSFNLQYSLGMLLRLVDDADFLDEVKDTWDGYYIRLFTSDNDTVLEQVCERAFNKFTSKYGQDTVPCTSTEVFNTIRNRGGKAAMVTDNEYYYITNAKGYSENKVNNELKLSEELVVWFASIKNVLTLNQVEKGEELIKKILKIID